MTEDWYYNTVRRYNPRNLKPSDDCIEIIAYFEGFEEHAYQDSVGVWTIGYGSTRGVKQGDVITEEAARKRMLKELEEDYAYAVQRYVKVPLTQYEFDALTCFTYNLGSGNLSRSTLLKLLNQGLYEEASDEFPKWSKAGGKTLKGLFRRRTGEELMFEGDEWERFKEISG